MIMKVIYAIEKSVSKEEFTDILQRSGLAGRRPVDDEERMQSMCSNAGFFVTARSHGRLIGVARSLSDLSFCTYLSDLAVDAEFQHQGIGKKLIELTKSAVPKALLILLSAPAAIDYYPKVGMNKFEHCYIL